jgi:hypothetical protein
LYARPDCCLLVEKRGVIALHFGIDGNSFTQSRKWPSAPGGILPHRGTDVYEMDADRHACSETGVECAALGVDVRQLGGAGPKGRPFVPIPL